MNFLVHFEDNMASNSSPKFRVAIMYVNLTMSVFSDSMSKANLSRIYSGAGLGGLLFALFLQKHAQDVEVDIYESAHALTELGAGVAMWPRVWELIKYLELEDELLQISGSSRAGGAALCPCSPGSTRIVD